MKNLKELRTAYSLVSFYLTSLEKKDKYFDKDFNLTAQAVKLKKEQGSLFDKIRNLGINPFTGRSIKEEKAQRAEWAKKSGFVA